jgi:hypothetical protein
MIMINGKEKLEYFLQLLRKQKLFFMILNISNSCEITMNDFLHLCILYILLSSVL